MYWTPWARLMKSITPNTSVSPAAIRNSSTPSCSPFRVWTTRRVVLMVRTALLSPASVHRALVGIGVAVMREHGRDPAGDDLAVVALHHLGQVEVLHREVVLVPGEIAADAGPFRGADRGLQRLRIG